jgi:hypothetical protein
MTTKHYLTNPDKVLIHKDGLEIFILSNYSKKYNLAQRYIEGNELCYLVSKDTALEDMYQGRRVVQSWDNAGPWFLVPKHGIIGANHGSPFAFKVTMLRHWLFEKHIGSVFTDDAGEEFVLVEICNLSTFILHSNSSSPEHFFASKVTGSLHLGNMVLTPEKVEPMLLGNAPGKQLSPHQRYNSVSLLADGKDEIFDGEYKECNFAVLNCNMDIIFPDALLDYLKSNPGKYVAPTAKELEPTINVKLTTTFQANSTRTIDCDMTILKDVPESMRYGVIQFYNEIAFEKHSRLVPYAQKITVDNEEINLANGYTFPKDFAISCPYLKENSPNPKKLPNRMIDTFGTKEEIELAVVLGYSETSGITKRGNEDLRGEVLMQLAKTTKMYPYAYFMKDCKANDRAIISCYQQYFSCEDKDVLSYSHRRSDGYFIYVDFMEPKEEYEIELDAKFSNKALEVIECDPSCMLKNNIVSSSGKVSFRAKDKSSIVLKVVE